MKSVSECSSRFNSNLVQNALHRGRVSPNWRGHSENSVSCMHAEEVRIDEWFTKASWLVDGERKWPRGVLG